MTHPRSLPNNALWAVEDAHSHALAIQKLASRLVQDESMPLTVVRQAARIADEAHDIERKLAAILPQATK